MNRQIKDLTFAIIGLFAVLLVAGALIVWISGGEPSGSPSEPDCYLGYGEGAGGTPETICD